MIVKCKINKSIHNFYDINIELFGLTFYQVGHENKTIKIVKGLFTSYNKAKELRDLINRNDLYELHILDLCEDAILDYDSKLNVSILCS